MLIGLAACDASEDEAGTATFTGQVINQDREPLAGATVRVQPNADTDIEEEVSTQTDADGLFSLGVPIVKKTELTVTVTKAGYSTGTLTRPATAGRTTELPRIRVQQQSDLPPESGAPLSVQLMGQSAESIMIKESGGQETATLTFLSSVRLDGPARSGRAHPLLAPQRPGPQRPGRPLTLPGRKHDRQ